MPKKITALKAIRLKCLECSNGSSTEVTECPVKNCPIYPYRLGHNPFIEKKELTDEQKTEIAQRLNEARKNSKQN